MKRYNLLVVLLIISFVLTSCVHSWPLSVFRRQPSIESRVGDLLKPWRWIFTRKDEDEADQASEESGPREAVSAQQHPQLLPSPLQFHQMHHPQPFQARPPLEPGSWFSLGDQWFYFPLAQELAW